MCFKTMADIGQVEFSNRCISWLCVLLVPCLSTSVPNVSLPVLESSTQWTRLLLQPWWHRRHLWPFWHFACVMGLFLTAYVFPFFNSKIMVLCSSTVCSFVCWSGTSETVSKQTFHLYVDATCNVLRWSCLCTFYLWIMETVPCMPYSRGF